KESTYREYLSTLRVLGLDRVPFSEVNVRVLHNLLQRVPTDSTRRKHAINLRAALGVPVPCPAPSRRSYEDLPPVDVLRDVFETSRYRMWAFSMLFAGMRLGEACTRQELDGNVIMIGRQRLPDGSVTTAKTRGRVVVPGWFAEEYRRHDPNRSHNTVYVGIRRAGKRHGLPWLTPHVLRHVFATSLVEAGAHPEVLRRQMRHHNVSVS